MLKYPEFAKECCKISELIREFPAPYDQLLVKKRDYGIVFARNLYCLFRLRESKPATISKELGRVIDRTLICGLPTRLSYSENVSIKTRGQYKKAMGMLEDLWERTTSGEYQQEILKRSSYKQQIVNILEQNEQTLNQFMGLIESIPSNGWIKTKANEIIKTHQEKTQHLTNIKHNTDDSIRVAG